VLDPDDETQRITVVPALPPPRLALVGGLAGVGPGPRRLWPGQPGRRSPWLPCASGCCLVLEERPSRDPGGDPATWLRYLIREVLAPRAAGPAERARRLGLSRLHRLDGRVLLDPDGPRPRLLVVSSNRVRVIDLDEDLFPVEPASRRGPGEVVPLERTVSRDGPRDRRPASAPRSPPS
jgi:hypothetical protein